MLKEVLIKKNDEAYIAVFLKNHYYLQISLAKAKVFERQLKHDLALI